MGKDWSHEGVVALFNRIRENGYQILYLSARAIGQAESTRDFIDTLD
jgi:phosphatidate phosphatase LPIN